MTVKIALDTSQYVQVSTLGAQFMQSTNDTVRLVFGTAQPAVGTDAFHELRARETFYFWDTAEACWALATSPNTSLVVTSTGVGGSAESIQDMVDDAVDDAVGGALDGYQTIAAQALVGNSVAAQEPSGTDTELQIEFGPASATADISLAVDGAITFLVPQSVEVWAAFRLGRTTTMGVADLRWRALMNGIAFGSPQSSLLDDEETETHTVSFPLTVEAADVLTFELVRDGGGADNGGLYPAVSNDDWVTTPSARLRIERV